MPKMSKDDEDWTKIQELTARRRLQNRISQRNHRQKIKTRLEQLEAAVAAGKWQPPESDAKDSNQVVADSNQEDADAVEDQADLPASTESQVDNVFDCFPPNTGSLTTFTSSEGPNPTHHGLSIDPFTSQPTVFQQTSASTDQTGSVFFGLPPTPLPSDFDFSQDFTAGTFEDPPDPVIFNNSFHSNDSARAPHVHVPNIQHDREQTTDVAPRNKIRDIPAARGKETQQMKSKKRNSQPDQQHSDQRLQDRRYDRSHRHSTPTSASRMLGRVEQSQRPTHAYSRSGVPPSPASSRAESSVTTTSMRTPDVALYSPTWSHGGDGYFPTHAMSPRSTDASDEDSGYSERTSRSASKVSDYCPNCACRQHHNPPEGWITIQIPAHYVLGAEEGHAESRTRYRD